MRCAGGHRLRHHLLAAGGKFDLAAIERARVLRAAGRYLAEQPVTVTASVFPAQRGRPARFLFRGRLLVARP